MLKSWDLSRKYLGVMRDIRRDLHRHPETSWTEFRTASRMARMLKGLGFSVTAGRDVTGSSRPGLPGRDALERCYERAMNEGADKEYASMMRGGFTGVAATLGKGSPVRAFRFDMDALAVAEFRGQGHRPSESDFMSLHDGIMHACGHDFHAAAGAGLAHVLSELREHIPGTVKLIFQPAEEGVGGAVSMAEAGVLEGIDELYGFHVLPDLPANTIIPSLSGFSATTKFDVIFTGEPAHAGKDPEKGANALLAACSAVTALHAIPRHSRGMTRVNVGTLAAGQSRNIIPDEAILRMEVRGETDDLNEYMYGRALSVIRGAAAMHGCDVRVEIAGRAGVCINDDSLIDKMELAARRLAETGPAVVGQREASFGASEDFSILMKAVAASGGKSLFWGLGVSTGDNAGLHTPRFDAEEYAMITAVALMCSTVFDNNGTDT